MGSPTLKNGIIDKDPESTALSTVSGILEAALARYPLCGPWDLGLPAPTRRNRQEDPPGERNGYPLQYSYLENPMNREAWRATVHGVTKSRTRWSD